MATALLLTLGILMFLELIVLVILLFIISRKSSEHHRYNQNKEKDIIPLYENVKIRQAKPLSDYEKQEAINNHFDELDHMYDRPRRIKWWISIILFFAIILFLILFFIFFPAITGFSVFGNVNPDTFTFQVSTLNPYNENNLIYIDNNYSLGNPENISNTITRKIITNESFNLIVHPNVPFQKMRNASISFEAYNYGSDLLFNENLLMPNIGNYVFIKEFSDSYLYANHGSQKDLFNISNPAASSAESFIQSNYQNVSVYSQIQIPQIQNASIQYSPVGADLIIIDKNIFNRITNKISYNTTIVLTGEYTGIRIQTSPENKVYLKSITIIPN